MNELKKHRFITTDELFHDANAGALYYDKSEADKVIADKDKEIARLDDLAHAHNIELLCKQNLIEELEESHKKEVGQLLIEIAELKKKLAEKDAEIRRLKRALWLARANDAKFWANYWFDVAPSEYIKYDRIGRMEGVEKEFILTKVTKHMTASSWVGLWEKVDKLCRKKAEEYK